jgi:hypothetical protein
MQDHNAVGRLTSLVPVTWEDGWPFYGLPGNLTRAPKMWVKPNTGYVGPVTTPYDRTDQFTGPKLANVWQWNHNPDDSKWSLDERKGYLRLHSLPAKDFWTARNSLTQRAVGPESQATTELEVAGLKPGDTAGLALLNLPYSWIGVVRDAEGSTFQYMDQLSGKNLKEPFTAKRIWLRVHCNFDTDIANYSYSTDGAKFQPIGEEIKLPFQLKTFQGVRYALFDFNTGTEPGGYADFNNFILDEPRPRGLTKPIPLNQQIEFSDFGNGNVLTVLDGKLQIAPEGKATAFQVIDRGKGRIALKAPSGQYVSVSGAGKTGEVILSSKMGNAETFQWVDMQRGDTQLLSLVTNRYILAPKTAGPVSADHPGASPDRKDGSCFTWKRK